MISSASSTYWVFRLSSLDGQYPRPSLDPDIVKKFGSSEGSLVLFDWDGVLADSLEVFTSIFLNACRQCRFSGLDEPGRLMGLFDGNMYVKMRALGLQQKKIDCILEYFRQDSLSRIDEIKLFDGVSLALNAIAESNVVAIITSNLSAIPLNVLSREGIRCVAEVSGAEVDTSKIRKIRQTMLRYPSMPAFYVGDTKGDMLEGRSAGAKTIAVEWGWHRKEKLKEGKPDFVVRSPAELASFFCNTF